MVKNFKELIAKDIEYIKHVYYLDITHKEKTDILSAKFGIAERTVRKWWANLDLNKISSDLPPQLQKAQERTLSKDTEVVLVTTAQNKTSVNKDFLNNLKAYQNYISTVLGKKCEIVVIPSKYRNPTNNIEDEKTKAADWWADEVDDYLFYGKVNFGGTMISCDSHISPTAKEPLNGYEILAANGHVVLGHSKIHFKTLPRFRNEPLRCMSTTGYITSKNYSKSKSGEVAFENHAYGIVVVEKDVIPRNVKVKSNGNFTDIIYETVDGKTSIIESSLGFVFGDIHAKRLNREFFNVSKLIVERLNPVSIILHDLIDGTAFNRHESKDMFVQRQKIIKGEHLIEQEINEGLDLIEELKTCCGDIHVVESNHEAWLDGHINDYNWKNDLHNSPAYLKYAYIQQTIDLSIYGNLLGYLIYERFGDDVKYVKMGESLYISDYQCGIHTDYGANGSRGNVKGFARMNLKVIGGHMHAPVLFNNVTICGVTCNLQQWYNRKGLSSWAYAHSVVHNNGKNQLLVFTDDYKLSGLI